MVENIQHIPHIKNMRKITKSEINVYISENQHMFVSQLRETGINLSSISRMAIRMFRKSALESDEGASSKKIRVTIYLENHDRDVLEAISLREHVSASEALRCLISMFLKAKETALRQLIVYE